MFENWTPDEINNFITATATAIAAGAAIASAVFALIAVRAQRAGQRPHVTVKYGTPFPVYGGTDRNLSGSTVADPWFAITVHNDGLLPVTVRTVALVLNDGGSAPFIRPPWPGADELPKPLASGDEATFFLDELRKVAQVQAEHGGAKWVKASIGGGIEFRGKVINRNRLDGWAKKT